MKKKIEELKPGAQFDYCGYHWVALDNVGDGVLVLAADTVFNRAFDSENRADWTVSTLREELGEDFANRLHSNGANFEQFVSFRPDLTANDGMKTYGSTIDGIALLSCEQYRKYRHIIPQATERWWTLTPWSCTKPYAAYVCTVKRDGTIDYDAACCDDWGVRPACVLEYDTLVDVEAQYRPGEDMPQEDSTQQVPRAQSLEELLTNAVAAAANGDNTAVQITIYAKRVQTTER